MVDKMNEIAENSNKRKKKILYRFCLFVWIIYLLLYPVSFFLGFPICGGFGWMAGCDILKGVEGLQAVLIWSLLLWPVSLGIIVALLYTITSNVKCGVKNEKKAKKINFWIWMSPIVIALLILLMIKIYHRNHN